MLASWFFLNLRHQLGVSQELGARIVLGIIVISSFAVMIAMPIATTMFIVPTIRCGRQ